MATTTVQRELEKTTDDVATLARTTADSVQKTVADAATDLKTTAEKVFLAGLGAFAVAEEEGSKLFDKLVKKGRKVELPDLGGEPVRQLRKRLDQGTDQVSDAVMTRARDARFMAGEAADKGADRLQEAVAGIIKRLGVPAREEIAELTASVERLNKRLDALRKERAAEPAVAFTMESVGGGWYELAVNGIVVEKVQGKDEAETALARLAEQKA